ncbi:MAG: OmpA family protein [Pirellulales bacterium]
MPVGVTTRFLLVAAALALAGCSQNPYVLQQQISSLQQQQTTLAQQSRELQSRNASLDKDNQELESLLAQERQAHKIADDQRQAMQDQLAAATSQIERLSERYASTEKKAEAIAASTRRRAGASITANNSTLDSLPGLQLPNVQTRRDGDVIRITIPAAKLFAEGSTTLLGSAGGTLDAVAAEVAHVYPEQFIGVEGHTDSSAAPAGRASHQQFTSARAAAVMEFLASRGKLRPNQLFVTGHGANHPIASNATPAGREQNRRIELVIYPERRP